MSKHWTNLIVQISNISIKEQISDNLFLCQLTYSGEYNDYYIYIDALTPNDQYTQLRLANTKGLNNIPDSKKTVILLGYDHACDVFVSWNPYLVNYNIKKCLYENYYYSTPYVQKQARRDRKLETHKLRTDEEFIAFPKDKLAYFIHTINNYFSKDILNNIQDDTDVENVDVENVDVENADVENVDVENADVENADVEDVIDAYNVKYINSEGQYLKYSDANDLLLEVIKTLTPKKVNGWNIQINGNPLIYHRYHKLPSVGWFKNVMGWYVRVNNSVLDVYEYIKQIIEKGTENSSVELLDKNGEVIRTYNNAGLNVESETEVLDSEETKNKETYKVEFPTGAVLTDDEYVNIYKEVVEYAGLVNVNRLHILLKDINLVSKYSYSKKQIDVGYGWYLMTDGSDNELQDCIKKISDKLELNLKF